MLDGLSFLKRPHDRVRLAAHGKVEPDLAFVLRRRKTGDNVIRRNAGRLHAVQRKEDRLYDARLARAVVPEDAGDAVCEGDLSRPGTV